MFKRVSITIPMAPITKKNSQRIIQKKTASGTVPMIIPSKRYKEYEAACDPYINPRPRIDYPVNVMAVYYMPTRRRVDLVNLHEALHDILVRYGVLEDDNSQIIVSTDGSRVEYDKENPRTEVVITAIEV